MYYSYFGLNKCPFAMTPDPSCLLLTNKHREALAGLLFAVTTRKGFAVVTGDAGTGKTTLLTKMMWSVSPLRAEFSVVLNPMLSPAEFVEYILMNFGLKDIPPGKPQRLYMLQQFLTKSYHDNKTCVLIVDEAHKLTPELLEEIRLLTNFETPEHKLLQIVLAGQTELDELLNREELRQVKQRIAVRLSIDPLVENEVRQYIRARWSKAGGADEPPFADDAIPLIASGSKGIPRVINSICDNALTNAFGAGVKSISREKVIEVLKELQIPIAPAEAALPVKKQAEDPAPLAASEPDELPQITFTAWNRYMPPQQRGVARWFAKLGFGFASRG